MARIPICDPSWIRRALGSSVEAVRREPFALKWISAPPFQDEKAVIILGLGDDRKNSPVEAFLWGKILNKLTFCPGLLNALVCVRVGMRMCPRFKLKYFCFEERRCA